MKASLEQLKPRRVDTELTEPGDPRISWPQRVAVSKKAMVATAHYLATEAGTFALDAGGNAFDAAVAAAFALGVVEPAASGLGGQTMALIHDGSEGRTIALDGSSRAPNRATVESLSRQDAKRGYKAMTVPSTPATLRYILERFGRLKLRRVLEPAIRFAEEGYEVSGLQRALTRRERFALREGTAAPFFLRGGKKTYPAGAVFKQPVLAETLKRIAKRGVRDFYSGGIAELIEKDMVANGGLIRRDDLAQVPRPIERRPLATRFQGHRVFTFPPPAAGRTLIQTLNVYEELPEAWQDLDTPRGALALAEVIRRAFIDRQDRPFDPNFFAQVSEKRMLKKEYAELVATQTVERFRSRGETTHLSVMDDEGNAIALTQSIEKVFGSCAATGELGFLYNNYMSAFEYENISHPYHLRPNAVPWASVAPTIIMRGKRPALAIGSPGSERITSAILQVLIRLEYHTPLAAVDAPRLHCSLDGKVSIEATRMRNDIPEMLARHGFTVDVRDPYSFYLGCVALVMRNGARFTGVADPRRDGAAAGPGSRSYVPHRSR